MLLLVEISNHVILMLQLVERLTSILGQHLMMTNSLTNRTNAQGLMVIIVILLQEIFIQKCRSEMGVELL
jgi:hypothetical protein